MVLRSSFSGGSVSLVELARSRKRAPRSPRSPLNDYRESVYFLLPKFARSSFSIRTLTNPPIPLTIHCHPDCRFYCDLSNEFQLILFIQFGQLNRFRARFDLKSRLHRDSEFDLHPVQNNSFKSFCRTINAKQLTDSQTVSLCAPPLCSTAFCSSTC